MRNKLQVFGGGSLIEDVSQGCGGVVALLKVCVFPVVVNSLKGVVVGYASFMKQMNENNEWAFYISAFAMSSGVRGIFDEDCVTNLSRTRCREAGCQGDV